jgi:hypothetical protein
MEELEEERKEIIEYLTGILLLVSNRDELETHFSNILNVVETSEETGDESPEYNSIRFQCLESECWDIFKEFTDKFYDSNGLQSLNHCPCCHHEFNYEDGIVNKKEFTPPKNIKELNKMSIPDAMNWTLGKR